MAKLPIVHEVLSYLTYALLSIGDKSERNLARQLGEQYLDESILGSLIHAAVLRASGRRDEADRAIKGAARATGQAVCLAGLDMKLPVLHELSAAGRSLGHAMAGDMESAAAEWTVHHKKDAILGALVAGIIENDPKERLRLLKMAGLNVGQAAFNVVVAASTVSALPTLAIDLAGRAAAGAVSNAVCTAINQAAFLSEAAGGTVDVVKASRFANTAVPAKAAAVAAAAAYTAVVAESATEATKFDAGATEIAPVASGPAAPNPSIGLAGESGAHVGAGSAATMQSICSTIATNFAKAPVTKTVCRAVVLGATAGPGFHIQGLDETAGPDRADKAIMARRPGRGDACTVVPVRGNGSKDATAAPS
ncbi:hypothetical protein HK405_007024 [Cladochytrium tenue]|nr:hypothetical protein HK405_007024 [Cladochytrium tenue]